MSKNWKTSLAGLLVALGTLLPNVTKPAELLRSENLTRLAIGAGLLVAKDHDKP